MAAGQNVGYRRVSTTDQTTARQLDGITLDRVFEDKASGGSTDRPGLAACLAHLRAEDTLIVHSMDRLARNLDDLRRLVRDLNAKGIKVTFIKESLTFTGEDSPMSNLLLSMLGAVAEFERALIRERQREGIAVAKTKGIYTGRKPALNAEQVASLKAQISGGAKISVLAREFGVSRETIYQYQRRGSIDAVAV